MNKEIKSLTGIRGVAALWVVLLHFRKVISHDNESYILKLLVNGFVAVDIFFLLSALVMCMAYSEEFKNAIRLPSYQTFIKKRFARIYPAYFFWVLISLAVYDFIHFNFNYPKIITNLLLIQNLFDKVEISFVFWSLCSEWILYLIFPFLYFVIQKIEGDYIRIGLILVSIVGIYILPSMNNYIFDFNEGMLTLYPKGKVGITVGINSIIRCFYSYVIGINLFLLIKDFTVRDTWVTVLKYCAIIGVLIVSYFGISAETYILTLMCSIVLISALYLNKGKTDSFFASKVIYFLGQISYSIYLCHMFVWIFATILIEKLFPLYYDDVVQTFTALGSLALIIPISYLSYHFVEVKVGYWLKAKLFSQFSGA